MNSFQIMLAIMAGVTVLLGQLAVYRAGFKAGRADGRTPPDPESFTERLAQEAREVHREFVKTPRELVGQIAQLRARQTQLQSFAAELRLALGGALDEIHHPSAANREANMNRWEKLVSHVIAPAGAKE